MICCFTGPRAFPWKEESSQHRDVLHQLDAAILQAIEWAPPTFSAEMPLVWTPGRRNCSSAKRNSTLSFSWRLPCPLPATTKGNLPAAPYASWPTGFMWWGTPNAAGRRSISEIGTWWITAACLSPWKASSLEKQPARFKWPGQRTFPSCGFTPLPHKGRGVFLAHNSRNRPHSRFSGIPQQAR